PAVPRHRRGRPDRRLVERGRPEPRGVPAARRRDRPPERGRPAAAAVPELRRLGRRRDAHRQLRRARGEGEGRGDVRLAPQGVGLHEDSPTTGWAVTPAFERELVQQVQATGATVIRAHYPLNPYLEELADRKGILLWSEIPVYGLSTEAINTAAVRRSAIRLL